MSCSADCKYNSMVCGAAAEIPGGGVQIGSAAAEVPGSNAQTDHAAAEASAKASGGCVQTGSATADSAKSVTVVKVGGGVLEDAEAQASFLRDFAALKGAKVLVHGGGREATALAARLGLEARMVDGRRVTDAAMLEIVTMVYGGLVNKRLVAALQGLGLNAIGLTGADLHCIKAHKRPVRGGLDFGYVGDIDNVDAEALINLMADGAVPVIAPLSFDGETLLNTNADTIASCTATALAGRLRVSLTYCFEKEGVLNAEGAVIEKINKASYAALKADGTVSAGMIPKLDNAFAALDKGVESVRITSFRDLTGGTLICR